MVEVYVLNAFTKDGLGGNPAGVVPFAGHLPEEQMQQIATRLGFPETAFVMKSQKADYRLRFFTPNGEVDLCGHATIGTFSLLKKLNRIQPGSYKQETKAGILSIDVRDDGTVFMEQSLPRFLGDVPVEEVASALNIPPSVILSGLPVRIVSTGLRDILIPVADFTALNSIQPDFEKIAEISRKYGVVGFHLFSLANGTGFVAHCRNFAPLYDIPEEAATGTSNGALGCYLWKYGQISAQQASKLTFGQGYSMNQPSEIVVYLKIREGEISEIKVGGSTSEYRKINFRF